MKDHLLLAVISLYTFCLLSMEEKQSLYIQHPQFNKITLQVHNETPNILELNEAQRKPLVNTSISLEGIIPLKDIQKYTIHNICFGLEDRSKDFAAFYIHNDNYIVRVLNIKTKKDIIEPIKGNTKLFNCLHSTRSTTRIEDSALDLHNHYLFYNILTKEDGRLFRYSLFDRDSFQRDQLESNHDLCICKHGLGSNFVESLGIEPDSDGSCKLLYATSSILIIFNEGYTIPSKVLLNTFNELQKIIKKLKNIRFEKKIIESRKTIDFSS